ncbi:hypothetical protein Droror1_Dr00019999 [Drosera rotundifolia]
MESHGIAKVIMLMLCYPILLYLLVVTKKKKKKNSQPGEVAGIRRTAKKPPTLSYLSKEVPSRKNTKNPLFAATVVATSNPSNLKHLVFVPVHKNHTLHHTKSINNPTNRQKSNRNQTIPCQKNPKLHHSSSSNLHPCLLLHHILHPSTRNSILHLPLPLATTPSISSRADNWARPWLAGGWEQRRDGGLDSGWAK